MKEKLVSLELAKLALKKGFDYPTYDYVWTDRDYIQRMCDSNKPSELHRQMLFTEDIDKKKRVLYTISVPTQSLLQKWLREVHKIHIVVLQTNLPLTEPETAEWEWGYDIHIINNPNNSIKTRIGTFLTYEDALENALTEALNLLEDGKIV